MHRAFTQPEHFRHLRPASGRPRKAVVMLALGSVLLAGCSSNGTSASSTDAKAGGEANSLPGNSGNSAAKDKTSGNTSFGDRASGTPNAAPGSAPAPGVADGSAQRAKVSRPGIPKVVGAGTKLTRNASLDLRVGSVETAAARVRALATGLQAQVVSEQIGKGSPGDPIPLQGNGKQSIVPGQPDGAGSPDTGSPGSTTGFGTLTLSVPADKLDPALDQLARIGTVLRRNTSSEDVTSQFVDTESRLKSMRASVERVRALMAKANDLGQVVALEGELSRRESDLESLESQLSALKNNVERSTVTISMSTLGAETVQKAGFGTGLGAGWDAFLSSAAGLATAVGATLPFALFLALVSAPLMWWWRRRRQPSAQPVSKA